MAHLLHYGDQIAMSVMDIRTRVAASDGCDAALLWMVVPDVWKVSNAHFG